MRIELVNRTVFVVAALLGLDKIRMLMYQDPMERGEILAAFRSAKEAFGDKNLQMAAPLAVFIGIEQALMYADFSKVSREHKSKPE